MLKSFPLFNARLFPNIIPLKSSISLIISADHGVIIGSFTIVLLDHDKLYYYWNECN